MYDGKIRVRKKNLESIQRVTGAWRLTTPREETVSLHNRRRRKTTWETMNNLTDMS